MARQRDVDWSDWKGKVDAPQSPLSKPLDPNLKKGGDLFKNSDVANGHLPVLSDGPKQPTKAEAEAFVKARMPTEAEIAKAEYDWENRFKNHFEDFNKPIDHLNKSEGSDKSWGKGKSFNSTLSKEELEERNRHIGE